MNECSKFGHQKTRHALSFIALTVGKTKLLINVRDTIEKAKALYKLISEDMELNLLFLKYVSELFYCYFLRS